ncbi:MAG: tRNA lysidine(34) synthetase TilS [Nitrospirota bacterium]
MAETIRTKRLFEPGARLLVAVSGGPDSVALLSILVSLAEFWDLRLQAIHVNHGLRGAESEEDARFVQTQCERLKVPVLCERILLNRAKRRSLQELAREARYGAMERAARDLAVDRIVLGHTADDQAETVLLWMIRGAGTTGLAGIPPVRDGLFVRPLLDVTRAEILAYLGEQGLAFRTDSSNFKPVYLRNRVRHELLPVLKRLNPAIVEVLTRQAEILREEDLCLERWAADSSRQVSRREGAGVTLDRSSLLSLPVALQRRIVRAVMREVGGARRGPSFSSVSAVLDRIAAGRSGNRLILSGVHVTRVHDRIRFEPAAREAETIRISGKPDGGVVLSLPVPSSLCWPPTGQRVAAFLRDAGEPEPGGTGAGPGSRALLDADRLSLPLTVRSWIHGDAFCPSGMGGKKKKLQDYFTDMKLSRRDRATVPLITAPEGILWVGGYRADHRFRLTPGTKRVLVLELGGSSGGRSE